MWIRFTVLSAAASSLNDLGNNTREQREREREREREKREREKTAMEGRDEDTGRQTKEEKKKVEGIETDR